MPISGLAAAGWLWGSAAQLGEGGLVADPPGVVAGGHEELTGELDAHAEELDQFRSGVLDQGLYLAAAEGLDLSVEVQPAPSEVAQRRLGRRQEQPLGVVDELEELVGLAPQRAQRFTSVRLDSLIRTSCSGGGAPTTIP